MIVIRASVLKSVDEFSCLISLYPACAIVWCVFLRVHSTEGRAHVCVFNVLNGNPQ
uniref:Uncharacterized protein n=1 Tax=Anopheles minimus TaxID=112268 RepID=A0A182WPY8_9DIPT